MTSTRNAAWRRLVRVVVCVAALGAVLAWHRVPRPVPAGAPADVFSAERALIVLRELVGNGKPHPVGSEEDARIREIILSRLKALHLNPEVHEGYGCSAKVSSCAHVQNVVARLPGGEGPAVLVAVHYDSVPAGPGASDDGAGVAAALEIARVLQVGSSLQHPVIFLFDEGEEAGLLGAEAFAANDPWRHDVGAVVNMEARGTSGPSRLFETSGPNEWLVRNVIEELPLPNTTSLYTTIYDRLPNDTDLTVFKRQALPGVNLAFIGGALRYHTPRDDMEHLDPGSLQQQGENALAAVRALADSDFDHAAPGRAVFFDFAGLFVVSWPEGWALPLAVAGLVLILLVYVRLKPRPALRTVLARVAMIVACAVGGAFLVEGIIRTEHLAGALPNPWVAYPIVVKVLAWIAPVAVGAGLLWVLDLFVDPAIDWLSCWLVWAILGIVSAIVLPGASYVFVAPVLVAGMAGILLPFGWWLVALIIPSLVAAVLLFSHLNGFYEALGIAALPGCAAMVAFYLATLAPLFVAFDRPRLSEAFRIAVVLLGVGALCAAAIPATSAKLPGPLTLMWGVDGDSHQATWYALTPEKDLPASLSQVLGFKPIHRGAPVFGAGFEAADGKSTLPAPDVRVVENVLAGSERHVKLHVGSARQGLLLEIIHGAVGSEESGSLSIPAWNVSTPYQRAGPVTHRIWAAPPGGLDVELLLPAADDHLTVREVSFGLPPSGQRLQAARPANQVPRQGGDCVVVSRTVSL